MRRSVLPLLAATLLLPAAPGLAHPMQSHGDHEHDHDHNVNASAAPVHGADPKVTIIEKGDYRYITSNGIPDHTPGNFPNRGNPNKISAQAYEFRVPLKPQPAAENDARDNDRPPPRALFGVALNGVPFDPGTAEIWSPRGRTQGHGPSGRNAWRYEALTGNIDLGLDNHNAHVQPTGAYHYHALPTGVYEKQAGQPADQTPDRMVLIGYAADGYPVYGVYGHKVADDPDSPLIQLQPSWKIKDGQRPQKSNTSPGGDYDGTFVQDWEYVQGFGDLDEHNGRAGVTPEYPQGTYYYVVSEDYPFVPRTFHGTPDESFQLKGGPPGMGPDSGDRGGRGERSDRPRRRPPPRR